ncbi:MAG TPA: hypothetical protein VNJ71_14365 [Gemmatimonadales bacterium]|jgi:hypothetical protein|nr:hypothetical protein [Gemmatimonadales bacterium]
MVLALVVLVALVLWFVLPRRRMEREPWEAEDPGAAIDREELEAAERDLRDLDPGQDPEEGWEGDDWGPGAGRRAR